MAVSNYRSNIRGKVMYQALDTLPTYLYDTSETSPDYFVISDLPTQLSAGKNNFKLFGTTLNLMPNTEIKIELLDSNGNPVYLEYDNQPDRLGRYNLSAYITPETSYGDGILTIVAVATVDYISTQYPLSIPDEWQNRYNIKWQHVIKIEPLERNNSNILFNYFICYFF